MSERKRWQLVALVGTGGLFAALVGGMAWRQTSVETLASPAGVSHLKVPPGFVANVFASGLKEPRFIRFGPDGALYVAERGAGRIVTLSDRNGDGSAEVSQVFADRLDNPHSVVFHKGAWYVGVPQGVVRLADRDGDGRAELRKELIGNYPTGGHNTRTIEFLADGRMVVSIGSSCNACIEDDPRRAAVLIYNGPDALGERVFAKGLRNAVGLAVHPSSGELWATNNGRDWLGDDLPPDALYIVGDGQDFGWPRCHNGTIADPDYGGKDACTGVAAPVINLQAHSAPLGLTFYSGTSFPAEYRGDLFIALHGSWNRSTPTGYKIVRLPLDGSRPRAPLEDFASGWLDDKSRSATGRPVGLAVGPDGSLYVSDDKAGLVYRISYRR